MSKKTRLEKRSSFRKGGMVALMGMSLFPFNPQLASATLFADPTAADSAFAPVPGRIAKQKNDTYGKTGSATLGAKGQKRIGAAALTGIRNDVSNMVNNVTTNVSTIVDQSKSEILQSVENSIVTSSKETIATLQASLGDSAPIIHEFANPVSNQFVQTMPYDGFVVMTVVGAGSGGNAGYKFTAGYGGLAGQFINEKKVAVAKGQPIYVSVGTGGAGASTTSANPQPGGGSSVTTGSAVHVASGGAAQVSPKNASCPPDAVGVAYFTTNVGDHAPGCSGGFGKAPVDSSNTAFTKAVKGTGGGATRGSFYVGSGTIALLGGQLDAKYGAGGGGGAPSILYVPSRGFSQDPSHFTDGGSGEYFTPGSKGGNGYVRLRIYDPNALITSERLNQFVSEGGASDTRINLSSILTSMPLANRTFRPSSGSMAQCRNSFYPGLPMWRLESVAEGGMSFLGYCDSNPYGYNILGRFPGIDLLSTLGNPVNYASRVTAGDNCYSSTASYLHTFKVAPVYDGSKLVGLNPTYSSVVTEQSGQSYNCGDGD